MFSGSIRISNTQESFCLCGEIAIWLKLVYAHLENESD